MKVLVVQPIHSAGMDKLKREHDVVLASSPDPKVLETEIADCDAVVIRVTPLPEKVINAATKLKVIGKHGAGLDNIDLEAAAQRGIPVVYSPGANDVAVAEHTVALMMTLSKKIISADYGLKHEGNYQYRMSVRTTQLSGKTIGIIGLGKIGQKVAAICKNGFQMRVLAFNINAKPELAKSLGVTLVDCLDDLLHEADFVSLHVPATGETRNMINQETLSKMKPTAILVNTSRGEIIDEAALIGALNNKVIAGAGLDVFAQEPPGRDYALFAAPNLIITPHMSAHTEEAMINMAEITATGVCDVLNNRKPSFIANQKLLEKYGFK